MMNTEMEKVVKLKLILLGERDVGKTSLLTRYTDESFQSEVDSTCGVDCRRKVLEIDGINVKLEIWDTAGQERFKCALPKSFFRKCDGAILMYDISNRQSFEEIGQILQFLVQNSTNENIQIMLIGNKADLNSSREVSYNEGFQFATEHDMIFFETSAKTDYKVHAAFQVLVMEVLDNYDLIQEDTRQANESLLSLPHVRITPGRAFANKGCYKLCEECHQKGYCC